MCVSALCESVYMHVSEFLVPLSSALLKAAQPAVSLLLLHCQRNGLHPLTPVVLEDSPLTFSVCAHV